MTRVHLFVLAAALVGCGPSIELSCKRLCNTTADCLTPRPTVAELVGCKQQCTGLDISAQRSVNDGEITEACYDASAELLECASEATCTELRSSDTPPSCQGVVDSINRECPSTSTTGITAAALGLMPST